MADRTQQELEERIALLEAALAEYTGLYGFTPRAAALQKREEGWPLSASPADGTDTHDD